MRALFLIACAWYLSVPLQAQYSYNSLYQEGSDSTVLLYELPWPELLAAVDQLRSDSFTVQDIDLVMDGKKLRFWAVCRKGLPQRDTLQDVARWDSLIFQKRKMAGQSYTMQDIEHYVDKQQQDHFVALWYPGEKTHKVWKFDSWRGLEKKMEAHEAENLFMADLEHIRLADGAIAILAIFHDGGIEGKTYINRSQDFTAFNLDRLRRRKSGYRMIDYEQYEEQGKTWHVALYRKGDGLESLRTNLDKTILEETTDELRTIEGMQIIDLEVREEKQEMQIPEKEK